MTVDELTSSMWWHVIRPLWLYICRLDNQRRQYVPDSESWRRLLEGAEAAEGALAKQITQLTGVPAVAARGLISELHQRRRHDTTPATTVPTIAWAVDYRGRDGHIYTTDHAHLPLTQRFGDDWDDPVAAAADALTDEAVSFTSLTRYESADAESGAHPGYQHRAVATLSGWTAEQLTEIQRRTNRNA
ncbi:hypothetical protein AB0B66_10550 [Catellatospora sp. NPDC049111]|uniref:hypothetical protein n=1 Tax=Catellatospora sp. NPDC049111 TaxID=3155271 RepID=UPI003406F9DF